MRTNCYENFAFFTVHERAIADSDSRIIGVIKYLGRVELLIEFFLLRVSLDATSAFKELPLKESWKKAVLSSVAFIDRIHRNSRSPVFYSTKITRLKDAK